MASGAATKRKGRAKVKRKKRRLASAAQDAGSTPLRTGPEVEQLFPDWLKQVQTCDSRRPIAELLKSTSNPYLWAILKQSVDSASLEFLEMLASARENQRLEFDEIAQPWIESTVKRTPAISYALECLAWVPVLSDCPERFAPQVWTNILDKLVELGSYDHSTSSFYHVWGSQLFFAELPITLAYHFPELSGCVSLGQRGCNFASESMIELLDGAGMPSAVHLDAMRPLLACWTRCLSLLEKTYRHGCQLSEQAAEQFAWFVRHALRLSRANRTHCFASEESLNPSTDVAMFEAALRWLDDRSLHCLGKLILRGESVKPSRLPDSPSYHSDWGGVAVLQDEWSPHGSRMVVAYGDRSLRTELCQRGEVVFSGSFDPILVINGQRQQIVADWEATCWFTDHDVNFLELESKLENGWTLQRQYLLARQDAFLWMADVVLGSENAEFQYDLRIPLCGGIRCEPAVESFEAMLYGSRKKGKRSTTDSDGNRGAKERALALVCPPSLPEWRSGFQCGALGGDDQSIRLNYRGTGRAVYMPLFIDLHRRRMKRPVTWRQLTVTEQLEIVPPDVAVGYRVHVGPEQWIVYRSLTERGNRTLIGQNYSTEFVCGRFLHTGEVEPIIELEPETC